MNNTCPNCGKGYNLQPHHVARSIVCKNCGASLVVEADGLHLQPGATTSTAPPDVPAFAEGPGGASDFDDEPRRGAPQRRRAAGRTFNPNDIMGALPPWLDASLLFFGVGLILVLIFTLFPVIDFTKVQSLSGDLQNGRVLHERKSAELRKAKDFKNEHLEDENKRWEKEREDLETREIKARAAAASWRYWYSWGILFGFVVLAVASLGFLRSETSRIRRVVGSIVLVAQILLMFLMFAAQSFR